MDVILRAPGSNSGGTQRNLPGEGDIDTRSEAEAALSLLSGDHASDDVVAGNRTYSRADLVRIRDGANSAQARPIPGSGISHGVLMEGNGSAGVDAAAHNGGGFTLAYTAGIPLNGGAGMRVHLDPVVGASVTSGSRDYNLPNGERANSAFTRGAGVIGANLRVSPNPAFPVSFLAGTRVHLGGIFTAPNATVSLPPSCTPNEFGRGECEPNAGPRTGNAGTAGFYDPRFGNSRAVSGLSLGLDLLVGVNVRLAQGPWGSAHLTAAGMYSLTHIAPGAGVTLHNLGGSVGVTVRFGGSDSVSAAAAAESRPSVTTATLSEQPAAGEVWNLSDDFLRRQLPDGARITGVSFDAESLSGPPYSVPAAQMTAGSHTLAIRYRMPGDTQDRVQELRVTVAAPVTAASSGSIGIDPVRDIER